MKQILIFCNIVFSAFCTSGQEARTKLPETGVTFCTADSGLQQLFDAAETKTAQNIVQFTPSMKILVEGGGYGNAWLETQPMGGEMYAKRNMEVALNNQLIFIYGQRADGRLPGMVINTFSGRKMSLGSNPPEGMIWIPKHEILADYEMFQGFCFPDPAWKMYFWSGKDRKYLQQLYTALAENDAYLWRIRDSNKDGLLETWCIWDTGEDNCSRLITRNAPTRWPFDFPPSDKNAPDPQDPDNFQRYWLEHYREKLTPPNRDQVMVPFASMDMMSYSYDGRATLAKIARELDNGQELFWSQKAKEVRQRLISGLWDNSRKACYDSDRTGKRLDELIHNNIRCMWYGIFTQEMADSFIKCHLLNPNEFWTPIPLPSIAVNEPLYRNDEGNSWSGQPQGLTYQRAIRGLENYGHFTEVSLLGQKLLPQLIRNGYKFAQQLDAQTGKPSGPKEDGYGPMMLAALEYISRIHGVHLDITNNQLWWSAIDETTFTYTQKWKNMVFKLQSKDNKLTAFINEKEIFSCNIGVRIISDLSGKVIKVAGIIPFTQTTLLRIGSETKQLTVQPNMVYNIEGSVLQQIPFDWPYKSSKLN